MHISNVLSVILLVDEKRLWKYASENFECGLCEHTEKSLDSLETHLFTCKIFLCDDCKVQGKTLQDLKNHVKSCNQSYLPTLYHKKMDREKVTEVISKGYFIED